MADVSVCLDDRGGGTYKGKGLIELSCLNQMDHSVFSAVTGWKEGTTEGPRSSSPFFFSLLKFFFYFVLETN